MRWVREAGMFFLVFAASILPASAGGYDGKWIAEIPPQAAPCNGTSVMTVMVMDGTIMGEVHTPWGHNSFNGKIDAAGEGTFTFGHDNGIISFASDHFDANWTNGRCHERHALGDREPNEDQKKAITLDRKHQQDVFAKLVSQAEDGEKIDFTALRQSYPYTEFWDPYGDRTDGLMKEAAAAQKGGDCSSASEKLNQVVKYDFTIDGAHALLSDCQKLSDPAKSRIESAIADGLIRSLMTSGDGQSEATAYVIGTQREEMDVLANRHIQFKTRQTNLRGSNGHYYDLIQGVSVSNGRTAARSIYFDVGVFVAGRQSRAAMISLAAANIH